MSITFTDPDETYTYNGSAHTPTVTVKDGNATLTIDTHYTVSYSDNINAGEATITITINGNRAQQLETHFTIGKADINPTVSIDNWTYGDTASTPSVFGNTGNGSVTYQYKVKSAADGTYSNDVPTEAGSYTVKATVAETDNYLGGTATADFTISKASISDLSVSIAGWTYGGTASTPSVSVNPGNGTVTYQYKAKDADDSTYSSDVPSDAGEYTVRATVAETTNYNSGTATADFTIAKADPAVTAPTPVTGLEYTGEAQELVSAGSTTGGTMLYSLDGAEYGTDIPTGTGAGSYTVYYKVNGDDNHNDFVAADPVNVTIGKADISPTVSIDNWTYGDTASTPSVFGNTGNGSVTYQYKVKSAADGTYSNDVPTDAGEYTVRATVAETDNYNGATATADFTISKASISDLSVSIANWTYGGTASTPSVSVNPGNGGVTYQYKVKDADDSTYSNDVPSDAGEYTVRATVAETDNYNGATATADFTIAKASISGLSVSITGWTYGEDANAPSVTGYSGDDVTYQYKAKDADDSTYSSDVPTEAGSYTVKATVAETTNYNSATATADFTIAKATATITAIDAEKTYGDADPTFNANVTGLVNGDDASVISYTVARAEGADGQDVGTYTIVPVLDGIPANYNVNTVEATLTINKATATVTAVDAEKTYGDADPTFTANVTGLVNGDDDSVISYSVIRAEGEDVGTYDITPGLNVTPTNYDVTLVEATFIINQKALTITAVDDSKTYREEDPEFSVSAVGLAATDIGSTITCSFTREEGENAGSYAITPSGATINNGETDVTDNYDITYTDGTLTIDKEVGAIIVTISANTSTVIYDGTEHSVSGYEVEISDDKYTIDDFSYSGETEVKGTDVDTYTETLDKDWFTNVNDNFTNVDFNVVSADITLTIKSFTAELADDGDNSEVISNIIDDYAGMATVTLKDRTFYKDGNWNTICLPFDVDLTAADCPLAGADVRTLKDASLSAGTLTLNFTTDAITTLKAGVPYLIRWAEDTEHPTFTSPVFKDVTVSATANDKTFDLGDEISITFKGTYKKLSYTDTDKSILFLNNAGETLVYPESGAFIGAQRAYFKLEGVTVGGDDANSVSTFRLNLGETTRLETLSTIEKADNNYYDLSGRRIEGQPTEKGVYILNGRKIVVK